MNNKSIIELQKLIKTALGVDLHIKDVRTLPDQDDLVDYIKEGHRIEFGWTLIFTQDIYGTTSKDAFDYWKEAVDEQDLEI